MKLCLGSEKCGYSYGGKVIEYLIKQLCPGIEIIVNHCDTSDVVISSHNFERFACDTINTKKKNYIYFSGETYDPPHSPYHDKFINVKTKIEPGVHNMYIPFFLFSPHLYLERKYKNNNRPFMLAYCNSNTVKEREDLFNIFVEKTSVQLCHSFGGCRGKYPETHVGKLRGMWSDDNIIDKYKDYKFVIAMENKQVDGYVTEKILNAFYSGAIPIYWGSKNINDFFNKKAFINVDDFESYEKCVEYILSMSDEQIDAMRNEKIYNEDNDIVNLLNDEYNKKGNKTLEQYLQMLKSILPAHLTWEHSYSILTNVQ